MNVPNENEEIDIDISDWQVPPPTNQMLKDRIAELEKENSLLTELAIAVASFVNWSDLYVHKSASVASFYTPENNLRDALIKYNQMKKQL